MATKPKTPARTPAKKTSLVTSATCVQPQTQACTELQPATEPQERFFTIHKPIPTVKFYQGLAQLLDADQFDMQLAQELVRMFKSNETHASVEDFNLETLEEIHRQSPTTTETIQEIAYAAFRDLAHYVKDSEVRRLLRKLLDMSTYPDYREVCIHITSTKLLDTADPDGFAIVTMVTDSLGHLKDLLLEGRSTSIDRTVVTGLKEPK